jgi:H/ACA ribonucleoprotein complex non-core subunit NAF1
MTHLGSDKSLPIYKIELGGAPEDQVQEASCRETLENKLLSTQELGSGKPSIELPQAQLQGAQVLGTAQTEEVRVEDVESQSVTGALEALLDGITPPRNTTSVDSFAGSREENANDKALDKHTEEDPATPYDPLAEPTPAEVEMMARAAEQDARGEMVTNVRNINPQEAEWEVDSSPIQSSSEETDSDDSSSSEDSDEEDAYKLLDPEEQARILMEGDGGSDDEGGGKGAKGSGAQLRTKNEVAEEVVPKPDVTITEEMKIEELGEVEALVENIALIKAKITGEYRVLESGSVLCLANRSVIGVVSETLGRVQQPRYAVRFTNAEEIAEAGLKIGTNVYYSEQHSTYVFTHALKAYKGSDASNLHDEEVGDEEVEFSDDEAEAEHRKKLKKKKMDRRGGKAQQNSGANRGHPLRQHHSPKREAIYDPAAGISYDDEDDGPYKPLARPAGFAETIGRIEAPQESMEYPGRPHKGGRDGSNFHQPREPHGRGGGFRGRGDRGRGNDRGRGRGNLQGRGGVRPRNDGYSQTPRKSDYNHSAQGSPMSPSFPPHNQSPQDKYGLLQSHYQPPAYPQIPYNQQQYQYQQSHSLVLSSPPPPPQQQQGWPNIPTAQAGSQLPAGAYINPAFFGNHTQQQTGQEWIPLAGLPQQQQQQQQQQWGAPQPYHRQQSLEAERAFQEAQERLNILRNLSSGRGQ